MDFNLIFNLIPSGRFHSYSTHQTKLYNAGKYLGKLVFIQLEGYCGSVSQSDQDSGIQKNHFLVFKWDYLPSFSSKRGHVTGKHAPSGCKRDTFWLQT